LDRFCYYNDGRDVLGSSLWCIVSSDAINRDDLKDREARPIQLWETSGPASRPYIWLPYSVQLTDGVNERSNNAWCLAVWYLQQMTTFLSTKLQKLVTFDCSNDAYIPWAGAVSLRLLLLRRIARVFADRCCNVDFEQVHVIDQIESFL
jgi:hypothetical protein